MYETCWGIVYNSLCMPDLTQRECEALQLCRIQCPCPGCKCSGVTLYGNTNTAIQGAQEVKSVYSYIYWFCIRYLRFTVVCSAAVAVYDLIKFTG